jgi:error-prone DNA polymerase
MEGRTVIQWDKDDLETLGLLKVDVLALGMLSAIRRSLALIGEWRQCTFKMSDIPRNEAEVYACSARLTPWASSRLSPGPR